MKNRSEVRGQEENDFLYSHKSEKQPGDLYSCKRKTQNTGA